MKLLLFFLGDRTPRQTIAHRNQPSIASIRKPPLSASAEEGPILRVVNLVG
ncbi:MAG: hypothetical protein IID45_01155 [Planctomycetes bacterium]|nr:hypothetical protein [Planctomycetota bacterium]